MRSILFFLICGSVIADSKVEADLRARLAESETARTELIHANQDLTRRIAGLQALALATANAANMAAAARDKAQAKGHAEEKDAVTQAQAESTQTLSNTDSSVKSMSEFEKQLARTELDVHRVVTLQQNETYLLIILTVLGFAFTGTIVFYNRRRPARQKKNRRLSDIDMEEQRKKNKIAEK